MTLNDRIGEALKDAMKSKDEARKRTLRSIKAQILLLKTDGSGQEITPEREIQLLQKMAKQREESLSVFEAQNREDLAVVEREELQIIKEFLPKQLDEEAIRAAIKEIIAEVEASSIKDLGKVMGVATKRFAGQADGKVVSGLVRELLS